MQLVILTKTHGIRGGIELGLWSLFTGLVVLIVGIYGAVYLLQGFVDPSQSDPRLSKVAATTQSQTLGQALTEYAKWVDSEPHTAQSHIDALTMRLGELQAHVSRLNVFSARLAEMADISAGEFDFDTVPAIGGPAEPDSERHLKLPELGDSLEQMASELAAKEQTLSALESFLVHRDVVAQTAPKGNPVINGWLSSGFGMRTHPVSGRGEFHKGLDFASPSGAKILSVGAGLVTWSDRRDGYGNLVEVDHGNGYITRYAHCRQNLVAVGDKVEKGQVIALVGSTGRSTGPHLHFEVVRDGEAVNPKDYIGIVTR